MHWASADYTRDSAREFLARSVASRDERNSLGFGLFRGTVFIGSIGFVGFDWDVRKTEIGYWISASEEGKGIVSGAAGRLVGLAFEEMEMNRIEIRCSTENFRSAAVAERLGFTLEGVIRQSELRNGRLHDFAVYGLLRSEWDQNRKEDTKP